MREEGREELGAGGGLNSGASETLVACRTVWVSVSASRKEAVAHLTSSASNTVTMLGLTNTP